MRPPPAHNHMLTQPLSARWAPHGHSGPDIERIVPIREALDRLTANKVSNQYCNVCVIFGTNLYSTNSGDMGSIRQFEESIPDA